MNAAQIHLALNHAPLFLSILGGGILILGMIKKNESFKNLSLYFLVAAALFTVPVFLTGEGTEELIEDLAGVNENALERHEDMAKISLIIIIGTGAVALAGMFLKKKAGMSRIISIIALILSLASFVALAQTAHLGGLIRHSELKAGATSRTDESDNEAGEENESDKMAPQGQKVVPDSLNKTESKMNKGEDDD